ncbi:coiled-coil domain-containing protein 186, partial [Elysia marginata]
ESEEIKSNSLEKDLKLKESELQTHLQERNDSEELHQMLQQELDSIKSQHKDTLEEAKTLRDKMKCLEDERQQNHSMIENYQEIMQRQKSDNTDLTTKLSALAALEDDYKRAQTMIESLDKDISDLKITNRDLQKDMDSCRERESKMLTLQSELSRANAMLRSENTNLSNKTESLEKQTEKHKENTDHLVQSLTQKTKESSDFKQKWEDEMDNSKTLKRRHANNVKDLTRQLQQARKKLVAHEGKGDSGSMGSRTNSNGSLNSADNGQHQQHGDHHQVAPLAPPQEFPVITEQVEVDKNVLIERIVRLQKSHARKNEKLEFLGEHIQQLLEEIKKKTKIIQTYALREEAGALSSDDMDAHKTLLARKGGIMASVYSVHQQDGSMTLDLSLQINKKLQAVLEDTLLKNITLKDNLDTLGEEIARLSQENRRLQLHLQELEKRPR